MWRWLGLWLGLWGCAAHEAHVERLPEVPPPVPALAAGADAELLRGAKLFRVASCVGCHSPPFDGAEHLGGGRDLPTLFGTFYAPNISPDREAGIGAWAFADFERAMRDGRAPDGRRYWPTFPYMTYTKLSDEDLQALWRYLQAQPPVKTASRPHEVKAPYSFPGMLGLWRGLAFQRGPLPEVAGQSAEWAQGRYLVRAVSYCDQCHSPRSKLGLLKHRHDMAGGANPGKADVHPNLTSHETRGIGAWTQDELARYLMDAHKPDGSVTQAPDIMAEKIEDGFSYYDEAERRAIAAYLLSLPPDDFDPAEWSLVKKAVRKQARSKRE